MTPLAPAPHLAHHFTQTNIHTHEHTPCHSTTTRHTHTHLTSNPHPHTPHTPTKPQNTQYSFFLSNIVSYLYDPDPHVVRTKAYFWVRTARVYHVYIHTHKMNENLI